jgi:L-fuconate dehydratase
MALTRLLTDKQTRGTGIALTLGAGNRLVCEAINLLAKPLVGAGIEDLMAGIQRCMPKLG